MVAVGVQPTAEKKNMADAVADVVCVGEVLWDSLPDGLFLGGAPFNVAAHLAALGVRSSIVTRVGDDRLGEEARGRAALAGVDTTCIQVDPELPTGFVSVTVDDEGLASYDIVQPAAWDAISPEDAALEHAAAASVLVFGTLAQRSERSRHTIRRLCELPVLRVLDVNRRPPFDDLTIMEESLRLADVVKCNAVEMERIAGWLGLDGSREDAVRTFAERFGCETVCVTRGQRGADLLHRGEWAAHPGFRITTVDSVGAGDAFLAALLAALLEEAPAAEMLGRANLLGAFVASRPGALPRHDAAALEKIGYGVSLPL